MTMTMTTASASASVVGASRRAMGGKSVRASMVASIGGARRERGDVRWEGERRWSTRRAGRRRCSSKWSNSCRRSIRITNSL